MTVPSYTAASRASVEGDLDALAAHLAAGLDPAAGADVGYSLLYGACRYGRRAAAKVLVAAGAPAAATRFFSRAPLVGALEFGDAELAAYLLERDAPADHPEDAYAPLMAAAEHGELAVVVALLDLGARRSKRSLRLHAASSRRLCS